MAARATGALAQILVLRLVDALGPTALERVANLEAESAHALYAHLDGVAVLHRAEVLVVGAQEEYVAGLISSIAGMTGYDRALEIDPRQSLSYSGKARIYRKTGAFIDAITSFEQLSMLHPKNALPY